jgi:hypothetical protein
MTDRSTLFYDVAVSFAGEDRRHARALADELIRRGVSVFYDEFERSVLWGKDLYAYLTEIYQNQAYFCVAFLSSAYARKAWTNHERKAAQARAFSEQGEYLLPIRLDDTEIPGILPTTGYITWPPDDAISTARFLVDKLTREGRRGAVPVVTDDSAPHQSSNRGSLDPFALKVFLDAELGPDGRMTPFSYSYLAGQLEYMGFSTIDQLRECISGYDHSEICRALHSGRRQGQITTFEDLVLAGMGPNYLGLHKWSPEHWFHARCLGSFRLLDEAGIEVGDYEPTKTIKT